MKKLAPILILAIAVLIAAFYAFNAYIYAAKQGNPEDVKSYRGTLSGEVVCLPHRDTSGPQTMECAIGLRTDVGEYYALDLNLLSQEHPPVDTGKHLTANGTITPIEMLSSDHWQKYDVEGIFSVTDSLKLE